MSTDSSFKPFFMTDYSNIKDFKYLQTMASIYEQRKLEDHTKFYSKLTSKKPILERPRT